MMAEQTRFFAFTGSKTFMSDWQAVGNLLTYMQSTVNVNVTSNTRSACLITRARGSWLKCLTSDWIGIEDDISAEFEEDKVATSTAYQMPKERLQRNWEAIQPTLIKSSLQMEGSVLQECAENDCSKTVESRRRDYSFTAYYCLNCCNRLHQTKHHFHQSQIKKGTFLCQFGTSGFVLNSAIWNLIIRKF